MSEEKIIKKAEMLVFFFIVGHYFSILEDSSTVEYSEYGLMHGGLL